jgi:hypothetical protein
MNYELGIINEEKIKENILPLSSLRRKVELLFLLYFLSVFPFLAVHFLLVFARFC